MENKLFLLSTELRAVAHVLNCSDYILSVTGDCDYCSAIMRVFSDYLLYKADDCLKVSENARDGDRKD